MCDRGIGLGCQSDTEWYGLLSGPSSGAATLWGNFLASVTGTSCSCPRQSSYTDSEWSTTSVGGSSYVLNFECNDWGLGAPLGSRFRESPIPRCGQRRNVAWCSTAMLQEEGWVGSARDTRWVRCGYSQNFRPVSRYLGPKSL